MALEVGVGVGMEEVAVVVEEDVEEEDVLYLEVVQVCIVRV